MKLLRLKLVNYIGIYNGLGLNEIDIDFSKCINRIVIIKGDNGTGKSTLFRALTPLSDSTLNFIPSMNASKRIDYLMNDNSIITISYISQVRENGERKPSKCYIYRLYSNGIKEDLNPSQNMTQGKDIIYRLFNLDDNFIVLSQLSAGKKGIGGLKPSERKRYVNNIISSLSTYNSMHKLFVTKSSVLKSMMDSILVKLNQIGNMELIKSDLIRDTHDLDLLEKKKDNLNNEITNLKIKLGVIDPDNNLIDRYKTLIYNKKALEKLTENFDEYNNELKENNIKLDDNTIEAMVKKQAEMYGIIKSKSEELNKLLQKQIQYNKEIDELNIKIESLDNTSVNSNLKDRIKICEDTIGKMINLFESIGFKYYDSMNEAEYSTAVTALENINNTIYRIADQYPEYIRKESVSWITKNWKDKLITKRDLLNNNIEKIKKETEEYKNVIVDFNKKTSMKDRYENIPKDCTHKIDGNCPFIKDIVIAQNLFISEFEKIDKYDKAIAENELNIMKLEKELVDINQTINCILEIINIGKYLDSITNIDSLLNKFPISNTKYDNKWVIIYHCIENGLPIDIDINKYREYTNNLTIIRQQREQIEEYKKRLKDNTNTNVISNLTIQRNNKQQLLMELLDTKNKLDNELNQLKIEYANQEGATQIRKKHRETYDKYMETFKKIDDINNELKSIEEKSKDYNTLTENLNKRQSEYNVLVSKDIPGLSNRIEQYKYKLVLFDQYRKDLNEFGDNYNKLQSLKKYTSVNGIQTVYMSIFMNSILQATNSLLQYLFNGRFSLQPFIINENEFNIPCLDSEGNLRPDISLMSDSQLSMISMIISFVLLNKASKIYNIIKLDEVDDNLDSTNRLQFSILIEQIMYTLNFDQCIIISHNNELNLANTDIIALRLENDEMINSIYNSGGNIIYSYNGSGR